MTYQEKENYIKKHFSKKCVVLLQDITKSTKKTIIGKDKKPAPKALGRRKHSCYICFEKFFSKDELDMHKIIHNSEKENDTFDDNNDDNEANEDTFDDNETSEDTDSETISADEIEQNNKASEEIISKDQTVELPDEEGSSNDCEIASDTPVADDFKDIRGESNYMCLKCAVYFTNQSDVKAHIHSQYFCKYYCKLCKRQFNTKGGFIVHVIQHDLTKVSKLFYRCSKCPISFEDCHQLKRHYTISHDEGGQTKAKTDGSTLEERSSSPKTHDQPKPASAIPSSEDLEVRPISRPLVQGGNSLSGAIPIYDCDICYDVFASQKALLRHKSLHKELDRKSETNNSESIVIEDDDVQIVQKEDTSNKHDIISNFVTIPKPAPSKVITSPMAKLTPVSNVKPSASKAKSILLNELSAKKQSDAVVDKTTITSDITQMLTGKKIAKMPIPPLPRLAPKVRVTIKQPVRPTNVNTKFKGMPPLMPISRNINQSTPENSQSASKTGKPQCMYVVRSPIEPSTELPSGMQKERETNLNSTTPLPAGYGVSSETSRSSSMTSTPGPPQHQYIINQQINSGGIVINPQATAASGGFVFNQNIGGNQMGVPGSSAMPPLIGLSSAGGQMFYIVLPQNQMNQGAAISPAVEPGKKQPLIALHKMESKVVHQHSADTPSDRSPASQMSVIKPGGAKKIEVAIQSSTNTEDGTKKSNDQMEMRMPIITNVVSESQEPESSLYKTRDDDHNKANKDNSNIVMPIITSVSTTKEPENLKNTGDETESSPENDETASAMVMPIITSIGTVAEDAKNQKEKIRKEPVSKYETEFAKFLKKADSNPITKKAKYCKVLNHSLFQQPSQEKVESVGSDEPSGTQTATISVASEDDIIFLDDNSSSSESELKADNRVPTYTIKNVEPLRQNINIEKTRPKIFVKKLSDLVDDKNPPQLFKHCCLHCNIQFKGWTELKSHLATLHRLYACNYEGCLIFDSVNKLKRHRQEMHHCFRCNHNYVTLQDHMNQCTGNV